MSFQKQSYAKQALGNPGEIAKAFHNNCYTMEGYTADANVCVGCFIQSKTGATNEKEVIGASGQAITGQILGVVTKTKFVSSCGTDPVHIYPKSMDIEYLNVGAVVIENDGQVAKKGQYVMLKNDDGALVFSDTSTKASHTYTGFRVEIGHPTADNGVILISTAMGYI
ncbi:hypothetical protein KXJ91_001423 [Campylobacter coli]|nr:hypothetical protein [Campylobacter coli]